MRSGTPPATGWSWRSSAASRSPRSVLQFGHAGCAINLLDTPGHQDFSEDTYRTLSAADSAVMLIDSAKGVETQTKKLFQVCRRRGIPIFTFINKLDRPGRDPFDLLHEVEEVLGIRTVPITWPIGSGTEFKGVAQLFRFARLARRDPPQEEDPLALLPGETTAPIEAASLAHIDALSRGERTPFTGSAGLRARALGEFRYQHIEDELELLGMAGDAFDMEKVLRGELSPAFFGSAHTEVGIDEFLDAFVGIAPPPGARTLSTGEKLPPTDAGLHRLRLQDPGEHGSRASRSARVPARLLRPLRARDGREDLPRRRKQADPPRRCRTSSSARSASSSRRRGPAT